MVPEMLPEKGARPLAKHGGRPWVWWWSGGFVVGLSGGGSFGGGKGDDGSFDGVFEVCSDLNGTEEDKDNGRELEKL